MVSVWFQEQRGFPPERIHFIQEWHDAWLFILEANGAYFHAQISGLVTEDNALVVSRRDLMDMSFQEMGNVWIYPLTSEDDPLIVAWFVERQLAAIGRLSVGRYQPLMTAEVIL